MSTLTSEFEYVVQGRRVKQQNLTAKEWLVIIQRARDFLRSQIKFFSFPAKTSGCLGFLNSFTVHATNPSLEPKDDVVCFLQAPEEGGQIERCPHFDRRISKVLPLACIKKGDYGPAPTVTDTKIFPYEEILEERYVFVNRDGHFLELTRKLSRNRFSEGAVEPIPRTIEFSFQNMHDGRLLEFLDPKMQTFVGDSILQMLKGHAEIAIRTKEIAIKSLREKLDLVTEMTDRIG